MPQFSTAQILDSADSALLDVQTSAAGPQGALPLTAEMLRDAPSGDLFGLTQNAGMGWPPQEMLGPQFVLLSTQGGVRAEDGTPIALGEGPAADAFRELAERICTDIAPPTDPAS